VDHPHLGYNTNVTKKHSTQLQQGFVSQISEVDKLTTNTKKIANLVKFALKPKKKCSIFFKRQNLSPN
jgi:hypothetical protein